MEKLITPSENNHFFGYYDKSPINNSKKLLLSHKVQSSGKKINKDDIADICVTNLENGKTDKITSTLAWNYQQGSQLQWISENKFIFNSYDSFYFAQIFDLESSKVEKNIKYPIYSISDDKKIYSSIDYSRIHKYREGYGYLQNEYEDHDSLLKICLLEDSKILIELGKANFKEFINKNFQHCWIDHILFSPNSYDFVFLFRTVENSSALSSYLFFYDYKKKKNFKYFRHWYGWSWILA